MTHHGKLGWMLLLGLVLGGCGSKSAPPRDPLGSTAGSKGFANAVRCDASQPGREMSMHDVAGRGKPDMVEVIAYRKSAGGGLEGHVVCVQLDTNHDGSLDILRTFTERSELESEEADRNYDGRSDAWIYYEKGQIAREAFDSDFDGRADEFRYMRDGKLKRIERDRNHDGKPDVWEFYVNDRLERMGVDMNFQGQVDAWYRDEVARAEAKRQTAATSSASPSASSSATTSPSSSAPASTAPATRASAALAPKTTKAPVR